MRRALVVVLVALAMPAVLPAAPAVAETTFKQNGNKIAITIPVDVVGATDRYATTPDGQSLIDYWESILNDTWGAAFKTIPYKSCYFLELKLKLTAQPANFDATDGRHRILVSAPTNSLTFDGAGFEGEEETSRDHVTDDGTRSMEKDRDGAIPVDAPPFVVAHEFGHLFGLGQDSEDGMLKGGRNIDTPMVGGDVPGVDLTRLPRVDRNLITRIGKIIEQYLKDRGKKLEPCVAWNGPIKTTYMASIEGVTCTAEENGAVTLGVVGDEVSGTIEASGSETCTGPGGTITEPTAVVIRLTGTFEDREFELRYSEVVGEHALTPTCLLDPTIDIPVERGTGSTELVYDQVPGYMTTCNITVEREADDDEPVG